MKILKVILILFSLICCIFIYLGLHINKNRSIIVTNINEIVINFNKSKQMFLTIPYNINSVLHDYETRQIDYLKYSSINSIKDTNIKLEEDILRIKSDITTLNSIIQEDLKSNNVIIDNLLLKIDNLDNVIKPKFNLITKLVIIFICITISLGFIMIYLITIYTKELLKSKQKAYRSVKAKTLVMKNVSHDLGNSLAAIKGLTTILYREKGNSLEYTKILDNLIKSTDIMARSIDLIREETVVDAKKSILQKEQSNLYEILNSVFLTYKELAIKKNIEYKFLIENKIDNYNVYIDTAKFESIVTNLIGNAIKFTKTGSVTLILTILDKTKDNLYIEITVQDTGIGINKNSLNSIFKMYEQADNTIQKEFGGYGQGLAICNYYLSLMGSKLQVTSKVNKGSLFKFKLDLILREDSNKTNEIKKIEKLNLRLLVAEDDKMMQIVIKDIIETELGYTLTLVDDGYKVLDLIHDKKLYDLILMDIRMVTMHGDEVTKQLRKEGYTIPIIALTANNSIIEIEEYKKIGFNACIGKPINIDLLQKTIISLFKTT